MEKTIEIDGNQVKFKSTAATPLRYKVQFGSEFITDLMKMYPLMKLKDTEDLSYETIKSLDLEVFYNILWALAKTADKNIPDPLTWLDEFDEFPLFEIFGEVKELLEKNLKFNKKK